MTWVARLRTTMTVTGLLFAIPAWGGAGEPAKTSDAEGTSILSGIDDRNEYFLWPAEAGADLVPVPGNVTYRLVWIDPFQGAPCIITATRDRTSARLRVVAVDPVARPARVLRQSQRVLSSGEWGAVDDAAIAALLWSRQSDRSKAHPIPDAPSWSLAASNDTQVRNYHGASHPDAEARLAPLFRALRSLAGSECRP
jgi:hypothetical protein